MRRQLAMQGIIKILLSAAAPGLLLFLPAGTLRYPGAWRMIGVLIIPMIILGTILLVVKPQLLAKRLNHKETEAEQKRIILFSALMFVLSFLLCAFDFRFGWSYVPGWISAVGCAVYITSYLGFAELLRENEYLSRTVEIQPGQKVVSTGLYGIVRHPMYAIIFWMFLALPMIIGSWYGMIPMVFMPLILVKRIINEERVLTDSLEGYEAYKRKVRYRLIPFVW